MDAQKVRVAPHSAARMARGFEIARRAGKLSENKGGIAIDGVPVVYDRHSVTAIEAAERKRARKAARPG